MTITVNTFLVEDEIMATVTGAPNDTINEALGAMSKEWTNLKYEGEMDGHHIVIHKVFTQTQCGNLAELDSCDILSAFYHAGCPEWIDLQIN